MPNYKNAVRESLLARLAVYLMKDGSRAVSTEYLNLPRFEGRLFYRHDGTEYAIVPKTKEQECHAPGINVTYLDFFEEQPRRLRNKRWRLSVVVRIVRPLAAGDDPVAQDFSMTELVDRLIAALGNGLVDIYDFRQQPPARLGTASVDVAAGLDPADESLPIEGGDTRLALAFDLTFTDPGPAA